MSKILKNNTGSSVLVADTGVTIAASGSYTIPPADYLLWAGSSNVITLIGDLTLTVNDGSFDLSISDGVDLIKGLQEVLSTETPVTANITISVANTEYSYALPAGTKKYSIQARGKSKLRLAYAATTNSLYETIWPGTQHQEGYIKAQANLVLYFQASGTDVIEIVSWH